MTPYARISSFLFLAPWILSSLACLPPNDDGTPKCVNVEQPSAADTNLGATGCYNIYRVCEGGLDTEFLRADASVGTLSVTLNWNLGPSQNYLSFNVTDTNGRVIEGLVEPASEGPAEATAEIATPDSLFITVGCDGPDPRDQPFSGRFTIP